MEEYLKRHQEAYRSRTGQTSEKLNESISSDSKISNIQNNNLDIDLEELAKTDPELASELLCQKLQREMEMESRSAPNDDYVRPPDSTFSECLFGSPNLHGRSRPLFTHSRHSDRSGDSEDDENLQAAIGQSLIEM